MLLNMHNNSNNSANVKIKLKKGDWEVEVECPEDKIQEVLAKVLATLPVSQTEQGAQEERKERSGTTCRDLIRGLWEEGWFSEPRGLSDVDEELQRRGYHYDRSAIAHSLTDLVREGILTRTGTPRNYRYLQKRPP